MLIIAQNRRTSQMIHPLRAPRAIGWKWAIVLTSVGFGLLHLRNTGANAESVTLVTLAGFFLAAVLYATRSLYAAWMAHFAWNWTMAVLFHSRGERLSRWNRPATVMLMRGRIGQRAASGGRRAACRPASEWLVGMRLLVSRAARARRARRVGHSGETSRWPNASP